MSTKLCLGYSPFNGPSHGNPIEPFNAIFDVSVNLRYAANLDSVDAVLLWGGADISPSLYNEHPFHFSGPKDPTERDLFEWELLRQAKARGIPTIGVCRGAQMMCAFAGGKLVQDCNNHGNGDHMIHTYDDNDFMVTSSHHQMMYPYDVEHELLASTLKHRATLYNPPHKLYCANMEKRLFPEAEVVYFPKTHALAVQCHPEWHKASDPFNAWMMKEIESKLFTTNEC